MNDMIVASWWILAVLFLQTVLISFAAWRILVLRVRSRMLAERIAEMEQALPGLRRGSCDDKPRRDFFFFMRR